MEDILIIPDAHAKPGISNERFTWLGRFIADRKPSIIVSIGDFADLPSLSSFDVGKKTFEGRRLVKDQEVCKDALRKIQEPIDELNKKAKTSKGKQYNPRKIITLGNHENRLNKAVNSDAKLEGTVNMEDLGFEQAGWEVIPFLEPISIEGVLFQHYFTSGSMDRAIGGENLGVALLKKHHTSCFQGHNHLLQYTVDSNGLGKQLYAGSVGCYFTHKEEWQSDNAQNRFWRGLILLTAVRNGYIGGFHAIDINEIKETYK